MAFAQVNNEFSKNRRRSRVPEKIKEKFRQPRVAAAWRFIWRQSQIVVGSLVAALGFVLFQVPFNLAAGGISGVGIILNHFTGFPVGLTVLALNIPLVVLGFFYLGRWRFVYSTVMSVICFSLGTDLFNHYLPQLNATWPITGDMLLASIYAGVLFGIGIGMVYRAGGTAGGSSIPARIIYERLGYPMSQCYLFTDGTIILIAGIIFNWEVALLATLTLVLCGVFSDFILEGISQVRTATIVTQRPDDVRWAILHQLRRGVTLWPIEGGYSRNPRTMVFCTVLRSRVADLKYAIATVDPDAFMVIGVAQQVVGGYGQPMPAANNGSNASPESDVAKTPVSTSSSG
ncbi:YitT family protein [Desulfospira joergensenii]|uniref:YitT family protein n=1 Tax=Desulfospira joergensenii TaxID=53329 RepID=UPI0003B57B3F|nr:YitT family protein [Desulfospira joergensenii]